VYFADTTWVGRENSIDFDRRHFLGRQLLHPKPGEALRVPSINPSLRCLVSSLSIKGLDR